MSTPWRDDDIYLLINLQSGDSVVSGEFRRAVAEPLIAVFWVADRPA